MAVQALFSYLERPTQEPESVLRHVFLSVNDGKQSKLAMELFTHAMENYKKLRLVLRAYSANLNYDKIAPINRAVLVVGLAELRFMDTPALVVINEYIEVAKAFGEARSASFVNGVLDNFRRNIGKSADKKPAKSEETTSSE